MSEPGKTSRNWWIWISALLALGAIGISIWAVSVKSDLDDTEAELAKANQELAAAEEQLGAAQTSNQELAGEAQRSKAVSGAAVVGFTAGYEALKDELGATSEDLDQTKDDLQEAEKAAEAAQEDADAAAKEAKDADNQTDKAKAETKQAQAEAEAATAKATVVANCGKAFVGAFGQLVEAAQGAEGEEGANIEDQVEVVRDELTEIGETCKAAYEEADA